MGTGCGICMWGCGICMWGACGTCACGITGVGAWGMAMGGIATWGKLNPGAAGAAAAGLTSGSLAGGFGGLIMRVYSLGPLGAGNGSAEGRLPGGVKTDVAPDFVPLSGADAAGSAAGTAFRGFSPMERSGGVGRGGAGLSHTISFANSAVDSPLPACGGAELPRGAPGSRNVPGLSAALPAKL